MPENSPKAFENGKLLLVAVVLGVLFVILFNYQRWNDQRRREANQVSFALIKTSLKAGQRLTEENVAEVRFPGEIADRLVGLRRYRDINLGQTTVSHAIKANSLLRLADTGEMSGTEAERNEGLIKGWRTFDVVVDPKGAPGAHIKRGSRVDLHGVLQTASDSRPRSQLILEYVKVLKVDGKESVSSGRGGSFSKMTIHVPPDLVDPIKNVEAAVKKFTVVARSADDDSIAKENEHPALHKRLRTPGGVLITVSRIAKPVREWLEH